MDWNLYEAPLQIQVALGGGYLGYLAAYSGVRKHHAQIDVAFLTLSFGIIATSVLLLTEPRLPSWLPIPLAVLAAVGAGTLWRRVGRQAIRSMLRLGRISYSDDDPTVLTSVFADTKHNVSQVVVSLDDGREFMCEDTARFRDAAISPFVLGSDGSVGLYVTKTFRRLPDGSQKETSQDNVRDPFWGDNMTIIPAERIRQINLRFQKK